MRHVEKPELLPHRCAMNPGITEDPRGFFQAYSPLVGIDPVIYISATMVDEMAKQLGMATAAEKAEFEQQAKELNDRIAALETELNEASSTLEAIDLIESAGFRQRKKTGRPPKAKKPEAKAA